MSLSFFIGRCLARGAALLCALTLAACAPSPLPNPYAPLENPAQPISLQGNSSADPLSDVAEALSVAVVGIRTQSPDGFGGVEEGIGSGVIVSSDGYILTNHHVAGSAWKVTVIFSDATQIAGQTLWSNPSLDLAVVKIPGDSYPFAALGDSASVRLGERVLAIGTPLTLQFQHTVTQGIISAKGRTLQLPTQEGETFMENLLQTDAAINPGNSGGPLINMRGEVIGINTLKIPEAEGIGFAIPIQVAVPVLEHFYRDGEYNTPYLGVYTYDAEIARYYSGETDIEEGLTVLRVDEQGPGAAAGIQAGDILRSADGSALRTVLDLRCATFSHKVGDTMRLTLERMGRLMTVEVALGESPL